MTLQSLVSLSFVTTKEYQENLKTLQRVINRTQENSLVVAHELCLTGFDYEHIEAAATLAPQANEALRQTSKNRIIIYSIIEKREGHFYNVAKVFCNEELIYERAKARLFALGDEEKYFEEGSESDIITLEVAGVKLALLICFELRFKRLWQKVQGADIVAVLAWWGAPRTEHFSTLTQALAIINQCYVVASDAKNSDCSKISTIITPQGKRVQSYEDLTTLEYSKKEIEVMRRYIDVGIE